MKAAPKLTAKAAPKTAPMSSTDRGTVKAPPTAKGASIGQEVYGKLRLASANILKSRVSVQEARITPAEATDPATEALKMIERSARANQANEVLEQTDAAGLFARETGEAAESAAQGLWTGRITQKQVHPYMAGLAVPAPVSGPILTPAPGSSPLDLNVPPRQAESFPIRRDPLLTSEGALTSASLTIAAVALFTSLGALQSY